MEFYLDSHNVFCFGITILPWLFGTTSTGKNISAEEVEGKLNAGAMIVDVRTPAEYAEGHVEGAPNIPHDQVAGRINEFGPNKEREIIVYCKVGGRAGRAMEILKNHGYSRVLNAGGYDSLRCLSAKKD